jgi:DNA repair protein RecO (recombination protein O)
MYQKTKGIVLHTLKYSETSVISKIYTEKLGLVSYIVKGVRNSKSKTKASLLQPLTLLDMEVSPRENKQLQFIKEFHRAYNYQSIPFDIVRSSVALFLLEVITKSIREHESNPEMFDFIYDTFCELDRAKKMNPDFHLLFLVHFARYLGFAPHDNYSDKYASFEMMEGVFTERENAPHIILNKDDSRILHHLLNENLFGPPSGKLSRTERKTTLHHLLRYYQLHVENFSLRSTEILEQVLE